MTLVIETTTTTTTTTTTSFERKEKRKIFEYKGPFMDQLLEAVSDAVSSIVLYSVEADESNAAIPNILPGAQTVKGTVDFLVELAIKSAELWKNFNQPDMRDKMVETCEAIKEACANLLEAATILANMPFSKPAKKTLLKGAKGIMEHMVVLLQQADLYEVTRLIRAARRVESKLKIFVGLEPGEAYFAQAAQDFVTTTVDLGKIVAKRTGEIDDFGYKRRFEDANTQLKVEVPVILQYFAYYQRDPNDKTALVEGGKVQKKIQDIIEEIIVVARLSAKSPFDLSMIAGLDLRDEDDLKDASILIAHEREKLLSAIEAGDGKEANRALKAIKKGLGDQIVISKALAKSADNPVQRKRLEDAARNAQHILDTVIAEFGHAVQALLAQPDNEQLLRQLRASMHRIKEASDQMVTSSAKLSSNDVAEAQRHLEDSIDKARGDIARADIGALNRDLPKVMESFNHVIEMAETLARATDNAEIKTHIERATTEARKRGSTIMGHVERLRDRLEKNPHDAQAASELNELLNQLEAIGKDLVKATSIGTSEDLFHKHASIEEQLAKLRQAALEGDKKETQAALRAVRKGLADEINIARSIARTTDDERLREDLEAAILKAEDDMQRLIEDLYKYANATVENPSDSKAIQSLDDIINSIDRLNASLLGAVSRELIDNNTKEIEAKLSTLVRDIKTGDQQAAVQTLKGVIESVKKQAAIAGVASTHIASNNDEPRAERVRDRAVDLTNTGPDLVKSVKALLTESSPANLQELVASINNVRDSNRDLANAVLLTTDQEILENAARIDADMRKIRANLEAGVPVSMNELNNLVKRMANQVKLANQHASTLKDNNAKKRLLESTSQLNNLVSLLVDACKSGNMQDPATQKKVKDLLDQSIKVNMDLFNLSGLSAADELVYGTPNLLKLIGKLEEAIARGDPDEIKRCLKELQEEINKQIFLARIAEASIDDPERKKQLQDAIMQLESLNNSLVPSVMEFLANPNSKEARDQLNNLLKRLRDGVELVSNIAATSPTEHLESKSLAVANEMSKIVEAIDKNNAADANEHHQRALAGIKQQIQLSKHIADTTSNIPQKREIIDLTERLEKQALVLSAAVKESLANPKSAAAKAKLLEAAAQTRTLMAQLIAASSNHVPEEQVAATAASIKRDLEHLATAMASGKPADQKQAIDDFKEGEQLQKLEQLKAYNDHVQDPFLKKSINDAIVDLESKLTSTIKAVNEAQQQGGAVSQDKVKAIKASADQAIQSSDRVIKASTPSTEERLLARAVKIGETLDRVNQSAKKGSKGDVENNVKELREELGETVNLIKQAAEQSRDPHKKVALNEIADKLKNVAQPISSSASGLADKPADARLQQELQQSIQQAKDLLGRAVVNATDAIFKANNDVNHLASATQQGDQKNIGDALLSLQDSEKPVTPTTRFYSASVGCRRKLSAHPAKGSRSSQTDHRLECQKAIQDLSASLAATNAAPEEKIIANNTVANHEAEGLVKSAKNKDKKGTELHTDTTRQVLSEQALLARALAAHTDNQARKQELVAKANAIEQILPQIDIASSAVQANPQDKQSADKLEQLVNMAKQNNQKIVNEALAEKREKEEREKQIKIKQQQEKEERERREKEEREKTERDEVAAAAAKIKERTDALSKDANTAEGKLYSTAAGIAGLMKDLSEAARTNDKKGMLTVSKLLSEQVAIYLQQAKDTAAKCTDPKLKEQIITAAQAAKNWTVQLKIIAAVKAASDDDDPTSNKQQLVKCAKGLSKAILETINTVEIGSIRAK
ncbi:putative actin binding protein [Cavenderia fasciculata]|uniref:Actin binding protein n=1 Tax=Cavenderia fasciculata TaxID=261658 RepID=F4PK68_CACFS|nr:putative actin binding protein [Cavenderia fasciculata]EGG23992.1 putative actin binding protein [Cavenderia fasciculata]|eukprot:XP_004361843.1 putative actin binding protein [Cavenderia fasciculata]